MANITYTRTNDGTVLMHVPEGATSRESAETARYDATVSMKPGTYTMRPVLIGGQSASFEEAYYFLAGGEGTLLSGGWKDENVGNARRWSMMLYGYQIRRSLGIPAK